jgi:plasmid stabilization system protein ParE
MATVRLSLQARQDLLSILAYLTEVAGPRTARKYDTKFKSEIRRLKRFPGIGSPQAEFGSETRLLTVNPYLIFYDGAPRGATVHVLRILDGRRDITQEMVAPGRAPKPRSAQ